MLHQSQSQSSLRQLLKYDPHLLTSRCHFLAWQILWLTSVRYEAPALFIMRAFVDPAVQDGAYSFRFSCIVEPS